MAARSKIHWGCLAVLGLAGCELAQPAGPATHGDPSSPEVPGKQPQEPSEPPITPTYPGAPPAISGGTLALSADGTYAVAADPDRDQVHVVKLATGSVLSPQLPRGSEPGRVAFDAQGRAHVVLRGAGKLAVFDPQEGALVRETQVCSLPRGLAFDAAQEALVVACAGGELVTLAASDHRELARSQLERDLRDVVIGANGDRYVSLFRSAELLQLSTSGELVRRTRPPETERASFGTPGLLFAVAPPPLEPEVGSTSQAIVLDVDAGATPTPPEPTQLFQMEPTLAWRLVLNAKGELVMLHQRAQRDEVVIQPGGYGSGGCDTISQTGFSTFDAEGVATPGSPLAAVTLAVDASFSADGKWVAVAAPGELQLPQRFGGLGALPEGDLALDPNLLGQLTLSFTVQLFSLDPANQLDPFCQFPNGQVVAQQGTGQVIAVSFTLDGKLVVQSREPAQLQIYAELDGSFSLQTTIPLSEESVKHPGHDLFHGNVGGGLACASCHGEAMDDGHVWTFADFGPRRTQNMRGGFLGTEPFHWEGDMADFRHLVDDVMTLRMSGFMASDEDVRALATWIDAMPALTPVKTQSEAAARGAALFASEEVGCASCHSGPMFTNNQSANVGTGETLQVPSLLGLALRAPYMHDGCAPTLRERFDPACGGGELHGHTAQLTETELGDLVAYLETL